MLFGLIPAWRASRVNLSETLNTSSRDSSAAGHPAIFSRLGVAEAAIAVMLLVGAGLMLQSFWRLMTTDAGFARAGVCAIDVTFRSQRYDKG